MKIKQLLFAAAFMSASGLFAQSLPDHSMYVNFGGGTSSGNNENPGDWTELLDTWEPGQPFSTQTGYIDDNFFISRVRLKNRFENLETQADKSLKGENDKNLAWLSPVGESTKKWGPLQRYTFNGDNFNMWQYMNIHGNWSNSWFRVPGSFNDVAHKNGVKTGCLYFIDWSSSVTPSTPAGAPLAKLVTKNSDGSFKYAKKFMQMLKYYGIDGVGLNPEGHWETNLNNNLQDFFGECHRLGEGEMNWPFHVDWYAFVSNGGSLSDNGCTLSIGANDRWFHKNGQKVTDVFFLNYNWGKSALTTSVAAARTFNRPKDVYAGFDQQGRGYGTGSGTGRWTDLAACPAGIAVWGNHATNQLYDSSNDNGSSDLNVQNSYVKRLELLFTGGTRNVLNTPAIRDVQYSAGSTESLKSFHGYSKVISAKSSLTTLPFVSRFNLGNGMFFKKGGVTTFNHK
ncbi:MAG: secretion protein Por, partial [Bacteroidaceae bacterium]